MANVASARGLSPVRYLSGAPYNGAANVYTIPASDGTAVGVGDPVLDLGSVTVNADGTTTKDVKIAATTDVLTGVVVAVLPDVATSLPYRAASTLRRVLVADDPNLLFEIQEINSGTPIPAADTGLNCSLSIGSPSTTTGYSGCTLDNTTQQTTNTLAVKLFQLVSRPDNAQGAAAKWLVRINRHRYADQLAGV